MPSQHVHFGPTVYSARLYSMNGELVWAGQPGLFQAGQSSLSISGAGLPTGVYLLSLESLALKSTRKVILLK